MSHVNSLRWARLSGVLLALATILLVIALVAGKGSTQESTATETDEPKQTTQATGEVSTTMDRDGDIEYNLASNGGTIELDAGPPWFHGNDHPLAPFVGRTVTVTGESGTNRENQPEIDVFSVTSDGQTTQVRAEGRPPWAGGPKVVGEKHPGFGKSDAEK